MLFFYLLHMENTYASEKAQIKASSLQVDFVTLSSVPWEFFAFLSN